MSVTSESEMDELTKPPWGMCGRNATLGITTVIGHIYLRWLNTTKVYDVSNLYKALYYRHEKQGLMTVSNHISTVDDPSIFGTFLPLRFFFTESEHGKNRWTMCAREMCFTNRILSDYFRSGKVLPVNRGEGLHQPALDTMARKLNEGDWVHVFPEGKLSKTGKLAKMKWGSAKILCETENDPVILPFYHTGLREILPIGSVVPRVGKKNTVVVGDPVDLKDLLVKCRKTQKKDRGKVYSEIMVEIEKSLKKLETECEKLHHKND
mmetsp:Transcript_725/g.1686  ORF Transcript_725/g.1686 Transcript_725/m.1686 type:complete len:265 (-) Transcript_725:97-891(-)